MKTLLYITFLLSSLIITAQIETKFYKNDVKTVEYLTVNFCVDSLGKTSSVKIIKNKTTYKNKEFIEEVVAYRKGIEYYPDTTLKNNCYDQTFEFINPKYENKRLSSAQCKNCEIFKKGRYSYINPLYKDVQIIRKKRKQIEKTKNSKFTYKIEWVTNCEYNLTYLKISEEKYKYLLGEVINVKIIDVLENGNYVYESNLLDRTILIGEMKKL